MKNILLIFTFTCISLSQTLFAQSVGIGTNSPDSSALLDISSTEKGLLIPRMSSADRQNIVDPAKGLMVYDTSNQAFYYFMGNGWLELLAGHVDHIEDADGDTKIQVEESPDEDIIHFDMGGTEFFRMDSGRIEVLNTGNCVFIGGHAGEKDTMYYTNNVGIGSSALSENTNGFDNIAIGSSPLGNNTTGWGNIALGMNSLQQNATGSENIAIGQNAMKFNETADNNLAVGNSALVGHVIGSDNTALGSYAGDNQGIGTRNTFLGSHANMNAGNLTNATSIGAYAVVDCDSCLVLGDASKVGIGTSTPTDKLHVMGHIRMVDGNQQEGYVMTSDSNGTASWQPLGSLNDNAWILSGNNIYNSNSGNVGIGTTTPNLDLSIGFANTGLQNDGANNLQVFTQGVQRMFIGNNIGIGTDSVTSKLTVASTSGSPAIEIRKDSDTHESNLKFAGGQTLYQFGTPNADRLRVWNSGVGEIMSILPNGNVGIRTTNPAANFHVNGSIRTGTLLIADTTRTALILKTDDNAADMGLAYRNTGGNFNWNIYRSDAGGNAAHLIIAGGPQETDITNLPERMRITNTGLVGIGTASPGAKLDVAGNIRMVDGNQQAGHIPVSDANGTMTWTDPNTVISTITDADHNTRIQVEESANEDKVRMDLAGTEVLRISKNPNAYSLFETPDSVGYSTFFGESAGVSSTTGQYNTFIGMSAGQNNTSGNNNTALGYNSGKTLTTGTGNITIGSDAGRAIESGNNNTIVGNQAGYGAVLLDNNVMIGYHAGQHAAGSGNVFLGYSAGRDAVASNRLYIENSPSTTPLIYGEFDNDLLAVNGTLWSTGNFGAGVANPNLDMSIGQANTGFQNDGSNGLQLYNAGVERVRFQSNGNVGIGTPTPDEKLEVEGNARVNGQTTTDSLKVGNSGSVITSIIKVTINYDMPQIGPDENFYHDFTVPGAQLGATVFVSPAKFFGKRTSYRLCPCFGSGYCRG